MGPGYLGRIGTITMVSTRELRVSHTVDLYCIVCNAAMLSCTESSAHFHIMIAQPILGTPPGPCNMHSADFIPSRGEVYVFRGGNGREYLNDLQ